MPSWEAPGRALQHIMRQNRLSSNDIASQILILAYEVFQASQCLPQESVGCRRVASQAASFTVLMWEAIKRTQDIHREDFLEVSENVDRFARALERTLALIQAEAARLNSWRALLPGDNSLTQNLAQQEEKLRRAFDSTISIVETNPKSPEFYKKPCTVARSQINATLHSESVDPGTGSWTNVILTEEPEGRDTREPFWASIAGAILEGGRRAMVRVYQVDTVAKENFYQDLQFLQRINHPNFPNVIEFSANAKQPYIAIRSCRLKRFDMFLVELCKGDNFDTSQRGRIVIEVLTMLCDLLNAVEHLDKEQILCDRHALKCLIAIDNLRVDESGKLLLGTNVLCSLPPIFSAMSHGTCLQLVKDASIQYLTDGRLEVLHCICRAIEYNAEQVLRKNWMLLSLEVGVDGVMEKLDSIWPPFRVDEGSIFADGREHNWYGILRINETRYMSGGFGDVYRGEWGPSREKPPCLVAVKRLQGWGDLDPKRLARRFSREYQAWRQAKHQHVLPLLGVVMQPECYFISPWCKNGTVQECRKGKPITRLFVWICQIASGLAYLHGLDPYIVHGDLKASNVMVLDNGDAALTDFGLSRVIWELAPREATTESSNLGTLRFLPPELLEGPSLKRNKESDVYSFGLLSVQVLSGLEPFHTVPQDGQGGLSLLIRRIVGGEVVSRKDHPPFEAHSLTELWGIFERCWPREPKRRPTMKVIHRELMDVKGRPGL